MQDHLSKTSVIRYLALCAGVVGLYYVVTSETVAEAILNFCFAGVIPGTDRALAPDTVMIGIAAAAGSLMLAIVVRVAWRLLRSRQATAVMPPVDADGHTIMFSRDNPITPVQKPTKVVHRTKQTPSLARVAVATAPAGVRTTARPVFFYIQAAGAATRAAVFSAVRAVPPALEWLGRISFVAAGRVASVLHRASSALRCYGTIFAGHVYLGSRHAKARTKAFLIWLEPHARSFDSWLEMRCRSVIGYSKRRLIRFESIQVTRSIVSDAKKSLKRPVK